jgi:transmembrane sensor
MKGDSNGREDAGDSGLNTTEASVVATNWLIRRDAGLSSAEEQELAAWLAADSRHERAFAEANGLWRVFDRAVKTGAAPAILERVVGRARARRARQRLFSSAIAVLVIGTSIISFWRRPVSPSRPAKPVQVASDSLQKLPDGSVVELRSGAKITVAFEAGRRRVELLQGEALFRVAKDPSRPFLVRASNVEVQAVGTSFSVDRTTRAIGVVVSEGTIAVTRLSPPISAGIEVPMLVKAGNCVEVGLDDNQIPQTSKTSPLSEDQIDERLAWRTNRLEFVRTELKTAIAAMNERNVLQIILDAPADAQHVSGAFRADNPEGFARIVAATFALVLERRSEGEIILRASR